MKSNRAGFPGKNPVFPKKIFEWSKISFFNFLWNFLIFHGQTGIILWKALVRAIIPEKMSTFVSAVQKILYMGDFWDFGSFKNFFSKKIFFRLRIVQFV